MIDDFSEFDWIFFDLDGTLWDHETACRVAVHETARRFDLPQEESLQHFHTVNTRIWREIDPNHFDFSRLRRNRWHLILEAMGRDDLVGIVDEISDFHIDKYLGTPRPLPAIERVIPLLARHSRLAIATNGFHISQDPKVAHLGPLTGHFEFVFCPDDCGALKSEAAFYHALAERAGNPPVERILMVGDSLREDIEVPRSLGWRTLWLAGTTNVGEATGPGTSTVGSLAELLGDLDRP